MLETLKVPNICLFFLSTTDTQYLFLANFFNLKRQRERKIKKLYLAVTTEPVPLGMHVHWMWGDLNARGQMGGTPCQFVAHTPPASRKKAKVSYFFPCSASKQMQMQ